MSWDLMDLHFVANRVGSSGYAGYLTGQLHCDTVYRPQGFVVCFIALAGSAQASNTEVTSNFQENISQNLSVW